MSRRSTVGRWHTSHHHILRQQRVDSRLIDHYPISFRTLFFALFLWGSSSLLIWISSSGKITHYILTFSWCQRKSSVNSVLKLGCASNRFYWKLKRAQNCETERIVGKKDGSRLCETYWKLTSRQFLLTRWTTLLAGHTFRRWWMWHKRCRGNWKR